MYLKWLKWQILHFMYNFITKQQQQRITQVQETGDQTLENKKESTGRQRSAMTRAGTVQEEKVALPKWQVRKKWA